LLRVLDEETIGFADFNGNRQYITLGNLAENPKAQLFLIDFAQRRLIKDVAKALAQRDRRIDALQQEIERLRSIPKP
jgi:uncharacterized protein